MALSHLSGISTGWLKAIPLACFGLAIPGSEFIIGLCIWLSFYCPLCVPCLSTIDNFGGHLLGCYKCSGKSHLQCQDHPGVLKSIA